MTLGLGLSITNRQAIAGGGAEPFERISNGGFDNDVGWNDPSLTWSITGGLAVAGSVGQWLSTNLIEPLAGGESFAFSFEVVSNPAGTSCQVQLYNSVTLATQLIFSNGATTGVKTASGTVSGAFDQWRIRTVDDPGMAIDNVSLVA